MSTEAGNSTKLFRNHLPFNAANPSATYCPFPWSGACPSNFPGAGSNGLCVRFPQKVEVFNLCLHRGDR